MRFLQIVALGLLLMASSCGLFTRNNDMLVEGTLTCQVDGADWTGDFIAQALLSSTGADDVLTITGQQSDGNTQVQVILNPFTGPGTYTIVKGNFAETNMGRYTGSNPLTQTFTTMSGLGEGSIEITDFEADGKVKGSFSFTAVNAASGNAEVAITNGMIDLEVTEE